MKSRVLFSIPILAILVAAAALFVTRGHDSSRGSAEAAAEVVAAFARVEDLTSFSMRQTSVTIAKGNISKMTQEMTIELPDRSYVKTTFDGGPGRNNEVVILGEKVFARLEGSADWKELSLRQLGINPDSMYNTEQEQLVPHELMVLGETNENGVELTHYRARIDGDELTALLSDLFLDGSPLQAAFEQISFEYMDVDYFVGKIDHLPYRGVTKFNAQENGTNLEIIGEVEYYDFNEPFVLPDDLP
jgi:hypothetical protein